MAPFDLKEEILRLKEERNAIILAHSYQTGDIQDMADYVGCLLYTSASLYWLLLWQHRIFIIRILFPWKRTTPNTVSSRQTM